MKRFGFRFAPRFAAVFAATFMMAGAHLCIAPSANATEHYNASQAGFKKAKIKIISTDGNKNCFTAELAMSPAQHALGLMFRDSLAEDSAMLFDFFTSRPRAMWMKNTLIQLDILFVDESGKITFIAENATPHSEETIHSPGPIRYVIELAGGSARRLGIKIGDRFAMGCENSE